jgi:hypothetical protein
VTRGATNSAVVIEIALWEEERKIQRNKRLFRGGVTLLLLTKLLKHHFRREENTNRDTYALTYFKQYLIDTY